MAHRLAPQAEADLHDIWLHSARENHSADVADRLIDGITIRFFLLSIYPQMGCRRDDLRPGLNSYPVREYVIFYRMLGEDVLILHVIHGSRNIEAIVHQAVQE